MSAAAKKYCVSVSVALIAGLLLGGFVLAPQLAIADGSDMSLPALVFPYALLTLWLCIISESFDLVYVTLWPLVIIQFPIYAALFTWADLNKRVPAVMWRIIVLHALLAIGAALLYSTER
jgi:hypothetical protein